MCGRFVIAGKKELLERRFEAVFAEASFRPRYNAAPSQHLPVILNIDPDKIQMVRWGLHPAWMKTIPGPAGLINVRAETLIEKPTFRKDLAERRCLVLADGFYEWATSGARKQPYLLRLASKDPFAFAGIWEENTEEGGTRVGRFAIITTTPNALVAKIHRRMPVILARHEERRWLCDAATDLLGPYAASEMRAVAVSSAVNDAKKDAPELLAGVE